MMVKRLLGVIGIVLAAVIAWLFIRPGYTPPTEPIEYAEVPFTKEGTLDFKGSEGTSIASFDLEIADNSFEHSRGLMNRKAIARNQAMLFFHDPTITSAFWMKNTHVSLDIIYADSDQAVLHIERETTPLSEALIEYEGPAAYVIEITGGLSDTLGIEPGITFEFTRSASDLH